MKYSCLIFLLIFLYSAALAHKDETLQRVNASRLPKSTELILVFDPGSGKFRYLKDEVATPQELPKYFSFSEVNLAVKSRFVNPLKFRLTLKSKEVDDPNLKVTSDFFTEASKTLAPVAGPTAGARPFDDRRRGRSRSTRS